MKIESARFGTIELEATELIYFPAGVIGFPEETAFALIRHGDSPCIGWLQSVKTPEIAFPVVSVHGLGVEYPDVPLETALEMANLGDIGDEIAVMAMLSAQRGQPATVNLMAPIIVNVTTRRAMQMHLEGTRYSTRELFVLPRETTANDPTMAMDKNAPVQASTVAAE